VRVAIDVQNLLMPMTGVGYYVSNLVRALSRLHLHATIEAFYFSRKARKRRLGLEDGSVVEKAVRFPPGRVVQFLWKRLSFPKADTFVGNADVFHFPNFVARPVRKGRVVVTIPDLSFLRFPQFTEPKNLAFLTRHVPRSIERADKVIAISEFTANEVCEFFPSAREKMAVTSLGVNEAFRRIEDKKALAAVKAKYNLPDDYILFVGTLEPRKNLMTLLEAYRIFREKSRGHARTLLVAAGMRGWLCRETMKRIRDMPAGMAPVMVGYVEEADLPCLYSAARMAVVPSFYEGFGLPCLEAMACATPLICSNVASLPEVVGDAAILVSPHDPEAMAEAMATVAGDPRVAADLADRGRRRAAKFTWERCAEETYRVYEAAMAG